MTTSLPARSQLKRHSIMTAGRDLFLLHGYRGASMDQIAAAAAVSKQTVYKHFGDKRELLLAIVTDAVEATVTSFAARIAGLADTADVEHDLTAVGVDYLQAVLAEQVVQLRRLVIAEASRVPELAALYYEHAPAKTLDALAATFRALDGRGVLTVPDPHRAAAHFAFLVVGKSIDEALFFGGPQTLARLDVADCALSGVRVFLAHYRTGRR